jgi:hypothetical protein
MGNNIIGPDPNTPPQSPLLQQDPEQRLFRLRQDVLQRMRQDENREWEQNYATALNGDPALEAEAQTYAKKMGVDPSTVKSDMDFARKFVNAKAVQAEDLRRQNPNLFTAFSEPKTMSVAADYAQRLREDDSTWGHIKRQVNAGWLTNVSSFYGLKRLLSSDGELSPEDAATLQEVNNEMKIAQQEDSWNASALRLLGNIAPTAAASATAVGAGLLLPATAGGTAPIAGTATMLVTGGNIAMMAGETYNQAREKGLSHGEAVVAATSTGLVTGYLGGKAFQAIAGPILGTLEKQFGSAAVRAALRGTANLNGKKLFNDLMWTSLKNTAIETGQELAETTTQFAAINLVKDGSASNEDWNEFYNELVATAKEVGKGMALLSPVVPSINAAMQMRYVKEAKDVRAGFDRLVQQKAVEELASRSGDTAVEITNRLAQESLILVSPEKLIESVDKIEAAVLESLAKQRNVTVEQLKASMGGQSQVMADLVAKIPDLMTRLDKARQDGVDMTMSAGEWRVHLLNTPLGAEIANHARIEGQTYTMAEAMMVDAKAEAWRKESDELTRQNIKHQAEIARQSRQVELAISNEYRQIGLPVDQARLNAQLMKHFVTASALSVGQMPMEWLARPENKLTVNVEGMTRQEAQVTEPGPAPIVVSQVPAAPADLVSAFETITGVSPETITDLAAAQKMFGDLQRKMKARISRSQKGRIDTAEQMGKRVAPLARDLARLAAQMRALEVRSPGQTAIIEKAVPFIQQALQEDLLARGRLAELQMSEPKVPTEAEAFPEGRDKATTRQIKAYEKQVNALKRWKKQVQSAQGKRAASRALIEAGQSIKELAEQGAQDIAPQPVGTRDIAKEIQAAKDAIEQMKASGQQQADIDALQAWIKEAEAFERNKVARVYKQEQTVPADEEVAMEELDLQKLHQILFHGTPWVWQPEPGYPNGRPRLDLIGRGEGVAAFGWGFYTSAVEDVAKFYRSQEFGIGERGKFDGKTLDEWIHSNPISENDLLSLMLGEYSFPGERVANLFRELKSEIKDLGQDIEPAIRKLLTTSSRYAWEIRRMFYGDIKRTDVKGTAWVDMTIQALTSIYRQVASKAGIDESKANFEDVITKMASDAQQNPDKLSEGAFVRLMMRLHREFSQTYGYDYMEKGVKPKPAGDMDAKMMDVLWDKYHNKLSIPVGYLLKFEIPQQKYRWIRTEDLWNDHPLRDALEANLPPEVWDELKKTIAVFARGTSEDATSAGTAMRALYKYRGKYDWTKLVQMSRGDSLSISAAEIQGYVAKINDVWEQVNPRPRGPIFATGLFTRLSHTSASFHNINKDVVTSKLSQQYALNAFSATIAQLKAQIANGPEWQTKLLDEWLRRAPEAFAKTVNRLGKSPTYFATFTDMFLEKVNGRELSFVQLMRNIELLVDAPIYKLAWELGNDVGNAYQKSQEGPKFTIKITDEDLFIKNNDERSLELEHNQPNWWIATEESGVQVDDASLAYANLINAVLTKSDNVDELADEVSRHVTIIGRESGLEAWRLDRNSEYHKNAAMAFLHLGYSGYIYPAGTLSGASTGIKGDDNWLIWDQNALNDMAMTERNGQLLSDARKGYQSVQNMQVLGDFDPVTNTILLRTGYNSSTITHEIAHWFLNSLERMAANPNASQQVRDTMDTMLKWFGVKDFETWKGLSLDDKREGHERFAISWEEWLLSGVAPTKELTKMFRQFRGVLSQWYNHANTTNEAYKARFGKDMPAMTHEVKTAFARMITTDDEIMEAEAIEGLLPHFISQEQWVNYGLDPADWVEYQTALEEARNEAKDELQKQSMKGMAYLVRSEAAHLRKLQKEFDAEYETTREQVEKDLKQEKRYKLAYWLSNGIVYDMNGQDMRATMSVNHKLDRDKVAQLMVGQKTDKLPKWLTALERAGLSTTNSRLWLKKDGLDPEAVATQFGFKDGAEMMAALKDLPSIDEAIDTETSARMRQKTGFVDVKNASTKELTKIVSEALHGKARAKFVAIELRALTKATQPVKMMNNVASRAATMRLNATLVGQVMPHKAKQEAKRWRAQINKSLMQKKPDSAEAAKAAQQELLHTHLYEQQLEFVKERDAKLNDLGKWRKSDEDIARTRDIARVNAGRALLSYYGLYDMPANKTPDALLMDLQQEDQAAYQMLRPLIEKAIAFRLQSQAAGGRGAQMPYTMLTVDEFRVLMSQLDGLWETAKTVRSIELGEGRKLIREAAEECAGQAEIITDHTEIRGSLTVMEQFSRSMSAKVTKQLSMMQHLCRYLDQRVVGPFTKYVWRPLNKSSQDYSDGYDKYVKKYAEILKRADRGDTKIVATELVNEQGEPWVFGRGDNRGKSELIKVLLNLGNVSNRKYLLLGYGWDPQKFDEFINRMFEEGVLTDADLDLCQEIWNMTDELGQLANEAHKKQHGYKLDMIPPTEVTNPVTGKKVRGGYIPIVPDKWQPPIGGELNAMLDGISTDMQKWIPSIQGTFLIERAEKTFPKLDLTLGSLAAHIEHVVRYATIQPALRDVNRLMRHPTFSKAINKYDPDMMRNVIAPWLQTVATQSITRYTGSKSSFENMGIWRELRIGGAVVNMSTNIPQAVSNLFGLFTAKPFVTKGNLIRAAWQVLFSWKDTTKFVHDRSRIIAQEERDGMFESLQLIYNNGEVSKAAKFGNLMHRWSLALQKLTQSPVNRIVWLGTYQQELAALMDKKMPAAEAQAEAALRADAAVSMTQNANRPIDVAESQKGTELVRTFIQYTGWFSNNWNLNYFETKAILRDEIGFAGKSGAALNTLLQCFLTPIIGSALITAWYYSQDDEEDEAPELAEQMEWFVWQMTRGVSAPLPLANLSVRAAQLYLDDNAMNDKFPTMPVIGVLESAIRRKNKEGLEGLDGWADLIALLSGGRVPANWFTDPALKMTK